MTTEKPVRGQVLQAAMDATLGSRNKSYGAPTPNLELANKLISAVHPYLNNKYSPAHNQAIYLALHKLARIACGAKGHTDNYVDAAAYFAIAAECEAVAANGNYWNTGSDIKKDEFWKNGVGDKDSLQAYISGDSLKTFIEKTNLHDLKNAKPRDSIILEKVAVTGDTETMLEDITRQNQEASQSVVEPSYRYDHYGESIKPNTRQWYEVLDNSKLPVLEVGTIFRSKKHSGDWRIVIFNGGEVFQAVKHPSTTVDGGIEQMFVFHKNSITHLLLRSHTPKEESNLKCLHCPDDPLPSKDVCVKCAMELGQ